MAYSMNASTKTFWPKKLDDGWPESVEEQSLLLLLVWRHYITRQYIKDVLQADEKSSIKTQDNIIWHRIFCIVSFKKFFTHRTFYRQTLLHTDAFTHRRFYTHTNTFTHRDFYTQTLLHTEAFTHRRFYTQTPLHTEAFTHRRFSTQRLLHTDAFTHRGFYTQTLLHTDPFTHKHFYTETFTHRRFYTQTLLTTDTHKFSGEFNWGTPWAKTFTLLEQLNILWQTCIFWTKNRHFTFIKCSNSA